MNRVVIEETFRRLVLNPAYLVFVSLLGIIAAMAAYFEVAAFGWPGAVVLLSLALGGTLIGPEFSSGTLQLILTKPVGRSAYLLSRVAGVALALWTAVAVLSGVEIILRLALRGGSGVSAALTVAVNLAVQVLLICALLAFFGSLARAYLNVALYVVGMIVVSMAPPMLEAFAQLGSGFLALPAAIIGDHPEIVRSFIWIDRNLFPERPNALDGGWLLLVVSNTAIALVFACLMFRQKEVPYGAD
jgi:ABC-type transport system involved in multi-copper enzyme maturation permease subunit